MGRDGQDSLQRIITAGQQLMARKGYTAVGIAEVLAQAAVPKGSFYHYFASKDAFGAAVMKDYFATYLAEMDRIFDRAEADAASRLMDYWRYWYELETGDDQVKRCLAVKVGAEVADLSDPLRSSLKTGTAAVIERLAHIIDVGVADGSVTAGDAPLSLAHSLYDLWLGASVRAKIDRDPAPLDNALIRTRKLLAA